MAITEEIDLTLDSLFAGDDDPSLKPDRWRREGLHSFVSNILLTTVRGAIEELEHMMQAHVELHFPNDYAFRFLEPKDHGIKDKYTLYYLELFKAWPGWAFDDTLGWGSPYHCGECGIGVTLLDRNDFYDCCNQCCANYVEKPMEL